MLRHIRARAVRRPFLAAGCAAVGMLLTVAAVWVYAHEGHAALPSKGASLDPSNPNLLIVQADARAALGVETQPVVARSLTEKVVAPATVVAPWQGFAFATSRLGGSVTRVHVQPGQTVTVGQLLGEVQSLALENLYLELLEAQNDLRLAGDTLADLKSAREAVSGQQLAEAEARHVEARNALDLARRKLLGLGIQEPDAERPARTLPIHSPLAGVVSQVHAQVGQFIEPAHHLFEIVDTSAVWVKISVLEKDLSLVQPGLPVEVRLTAYPGALFTSTLQSRGLALDLQSHQGLVWADFTNRTKESGQPLLPGMYGQAEILLPGSEKQLAIPADALLRDGIERFVLVETGPGQYRRQYVVLGRQTADFVEIRGGTVFPGDQVVTVGSHELARFFGQEVLRPSPEAVQNLGLETAPAQPHAVATIVRLTGEVDFPSGRRAVASARLAGTVYRLHIEREQAVQAGDVIAEVASLELQDLQLDLLRTHLRLGLLEQTTARLRALAESGGPLTLNRRQLREAESAATAARLKRDNLRYKLAMLGLSPEQIANVVDKRQILEALPVRAPIAGTVVAVRAPLGQSVKAEDPLVEVHDATGTLIRGFVSERQLGSVRVGQPARVRLTAVPGWVGEGVVVRSSQEFQTADRTLSVWVRLKELPKQPLRHGLLAELTLIAAESPATLAVPRSALLHEGTHPFLFVRQKDGAFERRRVQTGRADDRLVEITRALAPGEQVAVRGVAELQTGYAGLK